MALAAVDWREQFVDRQPLIADGFDPPWKKGAAVPGRSQSIARG